MYFQREEREGERERNIARPQSCPLITSPNHVPTGDLASNPGKFPDWELNWRAFGSQAGAQIHPAIQPGLFYFITAEKCLGCVV